MRLRLFFHPKVFEELHADTIDWSKIEPVFYQAKIPANPLERSLPLVLVIFLSGQSLFQLRKVFDAF